MSAAPQRDIMVVITREQGTYLVGENQPHYAYTDSDQLTLNRPVLMRKQGTQVAFEPLDMVAGTIRINISGQLGVAWLSEPYRSHYLKYVGLDEVKPAE